MNKKSAKSIRTNILLAVALAIPCVFAQDSNPINTILSFLGDIFGAVFNPSLDGLAILFKFLIIVITFAVAYEFLPIDKKGSRGLIAGAFALGAGLAIPTKLALTTSAFYGSFVIAILILLPFAFMGWLTYHGIRMFSGQDGTKWIYPGLALGWFAYFLILVYFLAHIGSLPLIFGWVFLLGTILTILSPLIVIILLGALIMGGDDSGRWNLSEWHKTLTRSEISKKSKAARAHFLDAADLLENAKSLKSEEKKHTNLRRAIVELTNAKSEAYTIEAQARKIKDEDIDTANDEEGLTLAHNLVNKITRIIDDLHSLVDAPAKHIDAYLEENEPHEKLKKYAAYVQLVSKLTPAARKPAAQADTE